MVSDAEDTDKAASLVQEAKRNYEKGSEDFKAARQKSLDAQELQTQASKHFYSLPSSHPATGAQVWSYRHPGGLAGPASLAHLYEMAHDPASGVTLDTLLCNDTHNTSLVLREAVAKHPVIQERFQSMASAISLAAAAAEVEKERRVARQVAAYRLLQPQALLAWLSMGDEVWIQCSAEPQALSVREIQDLVLRHSLSARLEFRAPTNGQTPQAADLIVLEYETLAARHLCLSLAGSLAEVSGSWARDSLPEPGNLQCWQRSGGSAASRVLHSAKAIVQLYQAGKWDIQQRLSHCSQPEHSMSFAAIHAACDRLSKQIGDLLRDPVVFPSSKARAAQAELEERLACQVKQQLREFVRVRCDEAERLAQQRKAQTQESKPAEGFTVKGSGEKLANGSSMRSPTGKTLMVDGGASAHTHLNGHSKASWHPGERTEHASEKPELAAAGEGKSLHAHVNGHSAAVQAHLSDDSEHVASQSGSPQTLMASVADAAAQPEPTIGPVGERESADRCRGASKKQPYDGGTQCEQPLAEEHPQSSRSPDEWTPVKQRASHRLSIPPPGQVHIESDQHVHANDETDDQEQRHTCKQEHEHRQQLSPRHRDRQKGSLGDKQQPVTESRGTSPCACKAGEQSTGPDQPMQGAKSICEAESHGPGLTLTPDQEGARHAESRLMLTGSRPGLDWDPDSLDSMPDEPMLLVAVPFGPRIFATGMTRGEFLKQREEIGRLCKSQAPDGDRLSSAERQMNAASSQAGQHTCQQVIIINGRTGAITQHSLSAAQHSSAPGQQVVESRQRQPPPVISREDKPLPPEKPMSRRAARELGDLIEGLPETAASNRQRRQPVPFSSDWHSSNPPPSKKRKGSETPEEGVLPACHTAAPVKEAKAACVPAAKQAGSGAVKPKKGARAGAAAQQDEAAVDWKLSNRQARELQDLMAGQQWDCTLPRGRRPPRPGLPAALPGSSASVPKPKGSAAQRDSAVKAPSASKAGKAKKRLRDPGKAAQQDPFICSRMLPVDSVSRRSTTTTRKAKRAFQVDEEAAGTARSVKRRVDRNKEILDWRKLKGKEADLKLTRSKVHAWGLTAVKPIQAEQFVIEYTGELIRLSVNSMRERLDSDSDYRFRVDDQWVVDATTKGGLARFINHCCDPNCYTKIVTVDNAKHILIFSKRGISAGDELSYDYKFETTSGEAPIPCTCGAKTCRGRLN